MNTTIKRQYLSFMLLFFILVTGAIFRLYRLPEYITFLGDEGRDVLVVKRIIVDHEFTLLGPITSVGSVYMGPIYYYFMVPFLWAWQLDPVGPAVMVVFFSLATIFLLYRFGSEFFHPSVGLLSSFFYATSPLTILYGRSSWNPNIVPFFALLLMYSLSKVVIQNKKNWFIIAGFSLGVLLQLHYVTFVFLPIIFIILVFYRSRFSVRVLGFGFLSFLLSYSPFLLFEFRHQFVNINGIFRFFLEGKNSSQSPTLPLWGETFLDVFIRIFWRLLIVFDARITKLAVLVMFVIFWLKRNDIRKNQIFFQGCTILFIWLFVGLGFLSVYKGLIYDYYLGSFFPLPFLLFGVVSFLLIKSNILGRGLVVFFVIFLTFAHGEKSPLKTEPNNLLANTREVAKFIYEKTKGQKYNFALIAQGNSDHAYRYFLEAWNNKPVTIENPAIDPTRQTVTRDLFVVCEEKVCKPLGHPLWEIAGFGRAQIVGEWKVSTAEVFHLTRYSEENDNK
ncbi:glycosyltransferase family 39 protein [Candidatus Gottesmanbacteria bacterium]|nr:glycosyltransferase family 39 protein [Candidatus Gottesmanbacteria bacterium]